MTAAHEFGLAQTPPPQADSVQAVPEALQVARVPPVHSVSPGVQMTAAQSVALAHTPLSQAALVEAVPEALQVVRVPPAQLVVFALQTTGTQSVPPALHSPLSQATGARVPLPVPLH
jgi:hypothetical protein